MKTRPEGRTTSRHALGAAALTFALFLPSSARADGTCRLLPPQNSDRAFVVDVGANGGVCSVELPNGERLESAVDDTADACSIATIGSNTIVIWPRALVSAGTSCVGNNVIVVWP